MKVLYLTNIPSPYRLDFFHELGRHCELTVWFESQNEANRSWAIELEGKSFRHTILPGRTFGLDKHFNPSIISELGKQPFDVYVISGYSSPTEMLAIHWLKLKRKRFLLSSDGGFPSSGESWFQHKLKRYLISSAYSWLSSGVNCTRYLAHYGAKQEQIYEYPFSSVLYSEEELAPLGEDERVRLKEKDGLKDRVLLAIGQFIPRKGFDVLLEAFVEISERDSDVSLLLIGGGPERETYERIIQSRGIRNVVVKDFMQKSELILYWKLADLFVFPTRYDIWGLVVNEALFFQLPVVSTTMAGAAFDLVLDGENGFRIDPDNVSQLADRCVQLLADPQLRSRFGSKSRELSQSYTMARMIERHVRVLEQFYEEQQTAAVGGMQTR